MISKIAIVIKCYNTYKNREMYIKIQLYDMW